MKTLRVLLIVAFSICAFAAVFAGAVSGAGAAATFGLTAAAFLAGVQWCDKVLKRRDEETNKREAAWQGQELLIPFRRGRALTWAVIGAALFALGSLSIISPKATTGGVVAAAGLLVVAAVSTLAVSGALLRSLASGFGMKVDSFGVHLPGWPVLPWSSIHGSQVTPAGDRTPTMLHFAVTNAGAVSRVTLARLLFGPLAGLSGRRGIIVVNASLLDVHPSRVAAAIQHLGLKHARRFDPHWSQLQSVDEALRAADRRKNEQADLAELDAAGNAVLSLAKTARDENDPAFVQARRRLDAAMARSNANVTGTLDEIKALNSRVSQQAKQVKWIAIVAIIVTVLVIVAKIYSRLGRS